MGATRCQLSNKKVLKSTAFYFIVKAIIKGANRVSSQIKNIKVKGILLHRKINKWGASCSKISNKKILE